MFEKGGVPMFDIHRPNVCEIPPTIASYPEKIKKRTNHTISAQKGAAAG